MPMLASVTSVTVTPMPGEVYIRRDPEEETFNGSFLIRPEWARRKQSAGVIIGIGDDVELNLGDHVIFSDRHLVAVELYGQELLVVKEEDVLAVLLED